jgi:hypothetical protein
LKEYIKDKAVCGSQGILNLYKAYVFYFNFLDLMLYDRNKRDHILEKNIISGEKNVGTES